MKHAEMEFQTQIAEIGVKSILSALPKKRNFTDRLLVEIVKRSISLGTRKYVGKSSSRSSAERIRPPALSLMSQVSAYATDTIDGQFRVYDRLPVMIAPHLEGLCNLRLALCYALASTPDFPVHLLLVGEPATVKTELLEEAGRTAIKSVLIGPRSTQAGLTMNLGNEYPGALARANNSLALIDELDKLSPQAIKSLYEAIESGRMTLNSGTLSRWITSRKDGVQDFN
jgi:DNA replicative helicase MCM subunit Mcm2 (Cdc46/Mcm family)